MGGIYPKGSIHRTTSKTASMEKGMTDAANTFKPPWAVVTWCDDRFIYVEVPCNDSLPYIFKESLTEDGLSKVLHLMRDARRKIQPQITGDYNAPIETAKKVMIAGSYTGMNKSRRRLKGEPATEGQRENVRAIMQKLGMGKK